MKKSHLAVVALILAGYGLASLSSGLYIWGKAQLGALLIDTAWKQSAATGSPVRPWPWADHWPVGKMTIDRLGVDLPLLSDDSGAALAFGPGLSSSGSGPGEGGVIMASGHRDTHFKFLGELVKGDDIKIESGGGATHYRVTSHTVIDTRRGPIRVDREAEGLLLVTCWPLAAIRPGGPMRLVVSAEPMQRHGL